LIFAQNIKLKIIPFTLQPNHIYENKWWISFRSNIIKREMKMKRKGEKVPNPIYLCWKWCLNKFFHLN